MRTEGAKQWCKNLIYNVAVFMLNNYISICKKFAKDTKEWDRLDDQTHLQGRLEPAIQKATGNEHIDFREGYWKYNVYLDGECIYTFKDDFGDIYAELSDFPGEDESDFLDELIDELQNNLMLSGKRKLDKDEIETLKRKMIDLDSWQEDDD